MRFSVPPSYCPVRPCAAGQLYLGRSIENHLAALPLPPLPCAFNNCSSTTASRQSVCGGGCAVGSRLQGALPRLDLPPGVGQGLRRPVRPGHVDRVRRKGCRQDGHADADDRPDRAPQRPARRTAGCSSSSTTTSIRSSTTSPIGSAPASSATRPRCWPSGSCGTTWTRSCRSASRAWSIACWACRSRAGPTPIRSTPTGSGRSTAIRSATCLLLAACYDNSHARERRLALEPAAAQAALLTPGVVVGPCGRHRGHGGRHRRLIVYSQQVELARRRPGRMRSSLLGWLPWLARLWKWHLRRAADRPQRPRAEAARRLAAAASDAVPEARHRRPAAARTISGPTTASSCSPSCRAC